MEDGRSNIKLLVPFLATVMLSGIDTLCAMSPRVYPTNTDPEPAPEIVALIKQRAEEKRLRKMKKRRYCSALNPHK